MAIRTENMALFINEAGANDVSQMGNTTLPVQEYNDDGLFTNMVIVP